MKKMLNEQVKKMKIGDYEVRTVQRGVEETNIGVAEGQVYYLVRIDKETQMDVKTQSEAEIISRLVRIEKLLKKVK